MKVSIEGNIGCGKSSILSRLCSEARIPVFLEPVDEWKEWLALFYTDPLRWGMSFNLKVLMSFQKWKNNTFFACYERSPISNRHVFAQLQYNQNRMNALELLLFDDIYNTVAWTPDVAIYIRTEPNISMERMQKRARSCEDGVPLDYINAVHERHEEIFMTSENKNEYGNQLDKKYAKNCKVFIVDGNRSHDEVYGDVLKIIQSIQQNTKSL